LHFLAKGGKEEMMHLGLVMECDYRAGATQEEAFDEAFQIAEAGEEWGLDGVWLAERHFAAPRGPLDAMGAGIPSIVSAPLIIAGAIAARTKRLRVGLAVSVLPLCHPVRLAEEAATVDQISKGRLDFGVGRSGFPRAYEGYGIPYGESRERFQECLDIILKAWTEEKLSYEGKYYSFHELAVIPKPYQRPYPPIRVAATTRETFPQVGRMGHPVFIGLRGFDATEAVAHLNAYRHAWREAGHPGTGDVFLRIPVYVAETAERARAEPEASTMQSYRRLGENFGRSAGAAGTTSSEERVERSTRLSGVKYDDLLQGRVAYGTPEAVVDRLRELRQTLGLSGIAIEPNVGGHVPREQVLRSIRLFAHEVVPRLR
jgi:alkanesulfonate monooxygenase SsuD/methylene tetrahydromethanopterin reductase-like flavin-dependent oxidoreductase (luciferase family)